MLTTIYGEKMTTNNPLAGYFRKPAIHMTLPSGGQFYLPGTLNMPETGELPVYPMTALDEITYKTPDALFNGSAVVDVIKSCVPNILDPWQMPNIDLTAILTSIKIASSGHNMEIDTQCPKCNEVATYNIDLRAILDNIKAPDYTTPLKFGDMQIFFKPLTYKQVNENNKMNFNDEQVTKSLANDKVSKEEKIQIMSNTFKKISLFTLETVAHNINLIRTPEADVTEFEYIFDFIKNCERDIYTHIKNKIVELREYTDLKPLQITCDNKECKHKYEQPFTLDMTNFFE